MKYTVMDCPGVERYEVAKFFWLEDAFEFHLSHPHTSIFYNGRHIRTISEEEKATMAYNPLAKKDALDSLHSSCVSEDESEWNRTHPYQTQPLQSPPMRSFGDPNWYQQGGTTAPKEYHRYVTVGDSDLRNSTANGEPNTIAST